jgi:hypothetical protein
VILSLFFGQMSRPPERHGAVVRSTASGRHDAYCSQCRTVLSTWNTPMEAMQAAAHHNLQRGLGSATEPPMSAGPAPSTPPEMSALEAAARLAEQARMAMLPSGAAFDWAT